MGSKVPQNGGFPAQDAEEAPVQNLTPLALSSPDKSVTVKNTHTYKQMNKKQ